ncbi:MAG: putative RND superfamily exporter protein [Moritella dasanensis]|jgi:predicted RND superfamily exporter protein
MYNFVHWVVESPKSKWLIFGVFLSIIFCGVGLKYLTLASDYKVFFDKNDKGLLQLERLQQTYTKTDNVFVMIKPPEEDVFTINTIKLLHNLSQDFWQVPHSSRVDSITNYPHSFAKGDDILIEEFVYEKEEITPERIEFMAQEIPAEKDLVGKLITEKGDYTALNITILLPGKDNKKETLDVNQAVEEIVARYQLKYPDYEFYSSGITVMNGAFMKAAKKDFATLIPLMMVFVLIAAGFILGSIKAAVIMLGIVLLSFVGALGTAGWLGIQLSAPSISAPIIMFTVIVASSIHIITYIKSKRVEGASAKQAVLYSYQRNVKPIILSHITTIIGFLAMNTSSSPPFRDLGNIVVFGVLISLIFILTLLPFILSKINLSTKPSPVINISRFSKGIAEFVITNRRIIVFIMLPTALGISSLSINNQLNDNLVKYFDESVEFRQHAEKIDEYFSGIYNVDYSLETGTENVIFQHEYLSFIERFEDWLTQQPEVVSVDSPLHRIKDLNRLMHYDDDAFYRINKNEQTNAQNFLLYELSLPFGRDTSNYISIDKSSLKVTARMRNQSSQGILDFESKANQWLAFNKLSNINVEYSSPTVIFAHVGAINIVNLLQGAFVALVIISFAMVFIFRSAVIGMISLIPNILPIAAAFGSWSLLNGQISMGLAGVAAMAIGIVVDDTVHFLFQYLNGLKQGLSPEDAVRQTFDKTMTAIIISSVLLVVGFMLLATSSFEKNADIGMLTSVTILLAVIFDLLLLPALAMTFIKKVKPQTLEQNMKGTSNYAS